MIRLRKVKNRPVADLTRDGITGTTPARSVRDQVAELGGTKVVAARMGRSERTIRRWAHNDTVPARGGAREHFQLEVASHRATPAYRRSQLNPRREKRMRGYGARLKFSGVAGPINDSSAASFKRRNIDFDLSPAALNDILDAYLTDGDQAAVDALGRALAGEYMQTVNYGWQFAPEAKAVDFLRHLT